MLSCERCGTSFSETRGRRMASCPRCRVRDGVVAPLVASAAQGHAGAAARGSGVEESGGAARTPPQRGETSMAAVRHTPPPPT
jgi:hypothetical protein